MATKYVLERKLDNGNWYAWGVYTDVEALVKAGAELGGYGYTETKIRVIQINSEDQQ
jgi:hypothetical protein